MKSGAGGVLIAMIIWLTSSFLANAEPPEPQYSAIDLLNVIDPCEDPALVRMTDNSCVHPSMLQTRGRDDIGIAGANGEAIRLPRELEAAKPAKKAAKREVGRANVLMTFQRGSAELTDQARSNAIEMAKTLASVAFEGKTGILVGHTDPSGGDRINLPLSRQRARAVRDFLVEQGVPAKRLKTEGVGSSQPRSDLPVNDPGQRFVALVVVQ